MRNVSIKLCGESVGQIGKNWLNPNHAHQLCYDTFKYQVISYTERKTQTRKQQTNCHLESRKKKRLVRFRLRPRFEERQGEEERQDRHQQQHSNIGGVLASEMNRSKQQE